MCAVCATLSGMESLLNWLDHHGLSQLHAILIDQDIDLDVIRDLSEADMAELGLTLGQRKRLLRAAKSLNIVESFEPGKSTAERRQLTVLFCDMVGSTPMSVDLELEDYREAIRDYQSGVGKILQDNNAFIARYMGDGVLAYFGYPMASEDDAIRAVSAGLQLVSLFAQSESFRARGLQARVGIATGLVVAGDIVGSGSAEQHSVLGDTPNLAARLQGLAEPNQLIIDDKTWQLSDNAFNARRIEGMSIKGFAKVLTVWQVLSDRSAETWAPQRSEMVGRDPELQTLSELWSKALGGEVTACLVSGDPGIGKSRLLSAFVQATAQANTHAANQSNCQVASAHEHLTVQLRGSNYAGNSVFHPVTDFLVQRLGASAQNGSATPLESLNALAAATGLEATGRTALADLLGIRQPAQMRASIQPADRHDVLINAVLEVFAVYMNNRPLLLVVEDLHLLDPSTIELLQVMPKKFAGQPVMLLASCRTEFDVELFTDCAPVTIALNPLDGDACRTLIESIGTLPEQLIAEVLGKGDGVPLFIEEITKALLQTGETSFSNGLSVPSTLQSLLMAKLDRLGSHKSLAQVSAVVGREISVELLEFVADMPSTKLQSGLQELVAAGVLMPVTDALPKQYVFRHALIQDVAYQSVLRDERRRLHFEVATTLRERLPDVAGRSPERVAWHLTAAASATSEDAIKYWQLAATRALDLSAYTECVAHINSGLRLLDNVEQSQRRDELEVELLTMLAGVYRGTKGLGADEIEETYQKTLVLAENLDRDDVLIPALNGLYSFNLMRSKNRKALEYAARLLQKATETGEVTYQMIGHRALGAVSFNTGDLVTAEGNLEKSLVLYNESLHGRSAWQIGTDHHTVATSLLSITQWVSGQPTSAMSRQKRATQRAIDMGHQFNIAQASVFYAFIACLDEHMNAHEIAQKLFISARDNGFPMMSGAGQFFMGSAMVAAGDLTAGRDQLLDGSQTWWATGTTNYRPWGEMRIAETYVLLGDIDTAKDWLHTASDRQERYGEHWCEPELHRLRGVVELAVNGYSDEVCDHFAAAVRSAMTRRAYAWLPKILGCCRDAELPVPDRENVEAIVARHPELAGRTAISTR